MNTRYAGLIAISLLAASAAGAAPVRALIFSGRNNHDWKTTTPYLKKLLTDSGRFDVRVEEAPAGTTAATLANFDVLIVDYQGPRWGDVTEKAVVDFVRSGKGLVLVHGALYGFSGFDLLGPRHVKTGITEPVWTEFTEMAGGTWAGAEPKNFHAPRHLFDVKFTKPDHPIARGMGATFAVCDELYHGARIGSGTNVLATAYDDPKNGGSGKDEPMLWTLNYGKGRVFYTALGHEVPAMQEAGFAITFARGAEWAGTGEVTLPPAFPEERAAKPVSVKVVVGGHSYDPELYGVFTGRPDLRVSVDGHPGAYSGDFRKDVDVLVLYDMVQATDVSDARRKNLRSFVESGKGLVVLHHAIADFNDWPWWYEQVVGGKYLLKAEGDRPASTYNEGEDELIEPVAKHPITRGLGPIHVRDEVYKLKWISPKVQVLLKTGHPKDDGPVVWISPYDRSRVVYIEAGHGREAHENPDYQELVHRAILWAAGRLE
jgi:type 1 glutamine amidotransferase